MAGRFERITLQHWSASDLTAYLGVPAAEAPYRIIDRGGYPGAVRLWSQPDRWRAYLRDAIVEPAIGRDLLALEPIRKPALLRQVVALACGHPAEIWSLDKICGALTDRGALETVAHYLDLLRDAFLVAPLHKHAGSTVRRRRSPPKLVVLDNALLVGAGDADPPSPTHDPTRWGRWVENACLAHAVKRGHAVTYWREEPWEVDGVLDGPRGRWLVEVKTGAYGASDLRGLAHAAQILPSHQPLILCDPGMEQPARQAGFTAVAWTEFLSDHW
jgi:predicted AAA+ superfamily ATPase